MSADDRIAAAIAGDRSAQAALLTELLPRVRNLVRYFLRTDDIDDSVQEGLVAILRGLPSYRGEGTLASWSDRIVARIAMEEARKRRRALTHEPPDEAAIQDGGDGAEPGDYLARRRVVRALDALSAELRETLVLHHVLEMSVQEIAAELAIPAETVRSRLRNGRSYLRERLTAGERRSP